MLLCPEKQILELRNNFALDIDAIYKDMTYMMLIHYVCVFVHRIKCILIISARTLILN